MGAGANAVQMISVGAGDTWLEEVCKALGLDWPLPDTQPGRDEMKHGKRARDILLLFAHICRCAFFGDDSVTPGGLLFVNHASCFHWFVRVLVCL